MISPQKGAVSIWLRTSGARALVEIVGAFDEVHLVETGDDDDSDLLCFQWRECPSSESFYGQTLHAIRALGLPEEPLGTYVLYDPRMRRGARRRRWRGRTRIHRHVHVRRRRTENR